MSRWIEKFFDPKAKFVFEAKEENPGRDPAQKPLKIWAVWAVFQQDLSGLSGLGGLGVFFLEKPLKPLKSCLKNRSKTAHFLRWFLNGFSSKIWAVFERFLSGLPGSRSQTPPAPTYPPPPANVLTPPPPNVPPQRIQHPTNPPTNVPPPPNVPPLNVPSPPQRTSNSSKGHQL